MEYYRKEWVNKMLEGGSHLGAVRNWIQRKFPNGEYVIWGSQDQLGNTNITVRAMEQLAQDIKRALFDEYKIKDRDHKYKYVVCANDRGPAFQWVDTPEEMWNALFKPEGTLSIYKRDDDTLGDTIFYGTVEEAREWLLRCYDEI